jgi:peptidoglycan/LPS O-acetylase OafA/YrhL
MSPNLDLLRAVAVLCVFFSHFHYFYTGTDHDTVWLFGRVGVLIFFVHTSLVLMQSLERGGGVTDGFFKRFYIQRAFRIYPLAIACVVISYALGNWTITEFISNLTLIQNLLYQDNMVGGLWTLPLEVQMYLMLPFLFIWFRNRPVYWLLGLWLLSIPLAIVQPMVTHRLGVIEYIPCFLGGVIAWRMIGRQSFPAWPLMLAGVIGLWSFADRQTTMPYSWAFCLILGLTIPWFREMQSVWLSQIAKIVARYSYGIYLSHMAVMVLAFRTLSNEPPVVQWATFVSLAIILPVLAFHLIEHPMTRLGRALSERMVARRLDGEQCRPPLPRRAQ